MPNFFGKKASKSKQEKGPPPAYTPFDFSTPDAFSQENMAKMGGVDTVAFDENDPKLMAELAELGWDDGPSGAAATTKTPAAGHRPRPDEPRVRRGSGGADPSGAPQRGQSGNDLLRSLGLSLNSIGDPELTEDDLQDPDLLGQLGEMSGDVDFGKTSSQEALSVGGERGRGGRRVEDEEPDDEDTVEPDVEGEDDLDALGDLMNDDVQESAPPVLPPRRPSATKADSSGGGGQGGRGEVNEISRLEKEVEALRQRAMDLKKAGDRSGALETMRAARSADHELAVLRTLETTRKVATVTTEYVAPAPAAAPAEEELSLAPAGAGGGGKPVSAELVMKQVKVLYQRAVELKKEGRTAEAMACMKRAKSLEADMLREAHGKGLVPPGGEGSGEGRRSSAQQRQGSSRSNSLAEAEAAAGGGAAYAPPGRKESRSGSRAGLPPSVAAAMKPKIFPAERDLFSDIEEALAAAVALHVERAKALVKKDRAAAAKEVKRYKELQAKLDLARDMRGVPGARPPPWQWKITKKSRVRVLEHVPMDQCELEISRVHGLTEKTGNKGSFWIKYDLGYSKDESIGNGYTSSYRCDADTVDMDFKVLSFLKRARSTQMGFQNRRTSLEIHHKKSMLSGQKLLGKCLIPLQPLLSCCELAVSSPILTEGRREAGGSVELAIRVRKPISSDEVVVTEEKELEVGAWPAVLSEPLAPAVAPVAAAPAVASASAPVPPAAETSVQGGGGAHPQTAGRFQNVVLTDSEKTDPFAVEHLDSNNVLEAEIASCSSKAATGDLVAVMRKGALETKLLMLVSAVQSGDLDLPAYCEILRERVDRDKVLAIHLKGEKRTKEAIAVMKRIRAMEEELAGVPQEEQGDGDSEEV